MSEIRVNDIYDNNAQNGDLPVFTGRFLGNLRSGTSGKYLMSNGPGSKPSWESVVAGFITAISDTNTVDLTVTGSTLSADVTYQNTATINLSEDASGLKADFASMNVSQFTNDSGYLTTTGITPSALTKVDDTNVTLTLGGSPSTALLAATSLTLGWTGTLADGRITSASTWNAKGYSLSGAVGTSSLADATTYYIGNRYGLTIATGDGNSRIYIPKTGTITRIDFFARSTGAGTTETSTLSFRLNSTTDTTLTSTLTFDSMNVIGNYTGLSIAVTAGDFFELKLVAPTWATNPTNTNIWYNIFVV